MHDYGFFGWGAGQAAGWLFMVLFWVLVAFGIVALIRWLAAGPVSGDAGSSMQKKTALQVLEERYARGELDREEFLEKKRDLGG